MMFSLIYKTHVYLCLLFFIPGLAYYPFFMEGFESYFSHKGAPYFGFFVGFFVFLFTSFFSAFFSAHYKGRGGLKINGRLFGILMYIIVFLYLMSSMYFFLNYSTSFRHKSRLAEAGVFVMFIFFIKPVLYIYVLMAIVYVCNRLELGGGTRFNLFLILFGSILSLNSSLQVIFPIIIFILLFFPDFFRCKLASFIGLKGFFVIFFLPFVVLLVLVVGIGNKVGYSFLLSQDGLDYFFNFGDVLFPRLSTSLFALVTAVDGCFLTGYCSDAVSDSFAATFSNRLGLLLGLGFDAQLIDTVNRFNYLYVFENHAERAGASPGPLASMFYFPFYPLGILIVPFFYSFIFSSVYRNLKWTASVNIVFIVTAIYLLLGFFEAPLNLLYVLDPAFFVFVFFIFITRFVGLSFLGR